jgi:hypothetical protein
VLMSYLFLNSKNALTMISNSIILLLYLSHHVLIRIHLISVFSSLIESSTISYRKTFDPIGVN